MAGNENPREKQSMQDKTPKIPKQGVARSKVLAQMAAFRKEDVRWHENRAFSLVFHHSDEHTEFLKEAHGLFFDGNGLNPMAFASLRRFEHDVVRMAASLLNGDDNTVGTMTSGGTESIMLAVRSYRDRARKLTPWIKKPEMVLPVTAHVAFEKAGKYFDVRMVRAPLGRDYRLNPKSMARLITPNTIALAVSAPEYPYGMVDPVEEVSAIALKHKLPLHVDACVGGFFLPWAERLGHPIPPFDFRVPGVTSMSADLHKYGYAAKGASTILYRSMDYLRHQFFACVDWPGGIFASPSFPGTRPGGAIAAAWAGLMAMGEDGYLRNAEIVMDTTRRFMEGVNAIDGLCVFGNPPASLFAYGVDDKRLSCYAIADFMAQRGWHIDRQQRPPGIHLMVNPGHASIVDIYLEDLRAAVDHVRANPDAALSGSAPAYGLMANAPMRGMVEKNVLAFMEQIYSAKGDIPHLDGEDGSVPKPVLALMKLKARFIDKFLYRRA